MAKEGKARGGLRLVRDNRPIVKKEPEAPASINQFKFTIVNSRGKVIFYQEGIDNYGMMYDSAETGFRDFIYLDTWTAENVYETTILCPGSQNTVLLEDVDGPPKGFPMEYPEDDSDVSNAPFSLSLCNEEGEEILARSGITSWDYADDSRKKGMSIFLVLETVTGEVFKGELFRPGINCLSIFKTTITWK